VCHKFDRISVIVLNIVRSPLFLCTRYSPKFTDLRRAPKDSCDSWAAARCTFASASLSARRNGSNEIKLRCRIKIGSASQVANRKLQW
jgi:hypothetical protein